jgi:hypothetical protein
LNTYGVNNIRQTGIYTAELSPVNLRLNLWLKNLKKYKLPVTDQIQTGMIQEKGEILRSEIHKLVNSMCIYPLPISNKAMKLTAVIIKLYST